ncbi:hypothetical protein VCR26J2_170130 [Vibrio coralliirubri]|nr:hypothetical protein VCR26J2_170130 [Vibrio coralliirubri]CDU08962.1 hypothetical protein VCR8J2_50151 [Vibrio coralliirubri]
MMLVLLKVNTKTFQAKSNLNFSFRYSESTTETRLHNAKKAPPSTAGLNDFKSRWLFQRDNYTRLRNISRLA